MSRSLPLRALLAAAALSAASLLGSPAQAVPSCGNQTHQNACGKANIYPCCPNGGNCTWWAWESVCRSWNVGLVNWGNANTWAGHANLDPNYDILGSPVVGSIATSTLGKFGHVAWVTGFSGSSVTVTEENCCTGCAPGTRTITYAQSKFNSGFVVRHGTACKCTPGQTESKACGDCGSTSRTCDQGCDWTGWSACNGPDPEGGNKECATGSLGPCGDGRVRCVDGSTQCRSLFEPSPEICDGVDNDCNGTADDGDPQDFGPTRPDYAATLVDVSYPQTLRSGEHASIWAEFRNDGTKPWAHGGVWLGARGAEGGGASALAAADAWPAWNVATVLDRPVLPGDTGRFTFEVVAPSRVGAEITESFQLQMPSGDFVGCPATRITPSIRILPGAAASDGEGGNVGVGGNSSAEALGGCSQSPASSRGGAWGAALSSIALLALARRRRPKVRG